jgi:hypothetical protein
LHCRNNIRDHTTSKDAKFFKSSGSENGVFPQQNMKVQEQRNSMTSLQQMSLQRHFALFNVNPNKVLGLGKTRVLVAHKIAGHLLL